MTRNNEARPRIWPIEDGLRPRSANHSGMNAFTAVTVNTAAMNCATRKPGVMEIALSSVAAGMGTAVMGGDLLNLTRHRGDAIASIGGKRLKQAEVLQEHRIGGED